MRSGPVVEPPKHFSPSTGGFIFVLGWREFPPLSSSLMDDPPSCRGWWCGCSRVRDGGPPRGSEQLRTFVDLPGVVALPSATCSSTCVFPQRLSAIAISPANRPPPGKPASTLASCGSPYPETCPPAIVGRPPAPITKPKPPAGLPSTTKLIFCDSVVGGGKYLSYCAPGVGPRGQRLMLAGGGAPVFAGRFSLRISWSACRMRPIAEGILGRRAF